MWMCGCPLFDLNVMAPGTKLLSSLRLNVIIIFSSRCRAEDVCSMGSFLFPPNSNLFYDRNRCHRMEIFRSRASIFPGRSCWTWSRPTSDFGICLAEGNGQLELAVFQLPGSNILPFRWPCSKLCDGKYCYSGCPLMMLAEWEGHFKAEVIYGNDGQ